MIAPKPLNKRRVERRPEPKSMTVCIAAACEEGEKCVTVTDGLLTYGGIAAEVLQHKRLWKGEWELMYAGSPEHFTMILGEWDEIQLSRTGATTRRNVQETLSNAFRAFLSKASSFSVLSPFDLSLEEFKKGGLEMMGRGRFRHMSEQIEANAATIQDQILAVGWGHAPASVMIYEVSGYGGKSYANGGIAAIGSGRDVALSNLLLLGQNRSLSLARTIYNVAAAKFSAEHSSGLYVGKKRPTCSFHGNEQMPIPTQLLAPPCRRTRSASYALSGNSTDVLASRARP